MNDGGKGSTQRPVNMDVFAENFDKIFRSKPMDEQTRELDLQLGDATAEIKLLKEYSTLLEEIIDEAGDIVKFVEAGKQGEAFQHIQYYMAQVEKLRQWKEKNGK